MDSSQSGNKSVTVEPESLVCSRCWNQIFLNEEFAKACWTSKVDKVYLDGFEYEISLQEIFESAEEGCSWCRSIAPDAIYLYSHDDDDDFGDFYFKVNVHPQRSKEQTPPGNFIFTRQLRTGIYTVISVHSDFSIFTEEDNVASGCVKARPLQTQLHSDAAFQQARSWIRDCSNHELCRKPGEACLPTRVIEVSPNEGRGNPRLLQTNGKTGLYATLSYCWGKNQPGLTTLESLPGRLTEIKLAEISQTAQDAVYCTKALGIKYLWVDALCIIQDSDEDKAQEIAKMRNIYRNSLITIVAASSDSATIGFLEDRPPSIPTLRVPWPCPDRQIGTVSLMTTRGHPYHRYHEEPVFRRAWTVQEAYLSPRLLVYCSDTLQFHCQTTTLNLGDWLYMGGSHPRLPNHIIHPQQHVVEMGPEQLREILDDWGKVASVYSARQLTYSSDKLIAIGGLAEVFSESLGIRYVAGLWEVNLEHYLNWIASEEIASDVPQKPRPSEYRGPSWSWVSVDDPIRWYALVKDVQYRCEVLECQVTLLSESAPFGPITSGYLKIKGFLKKDIYSYAQVRFDTADDTSNSRDLIYGFATAFNIDSIIGLVLIPVKNRSWIFRRIGFFHRGKKEDFELCESMIITII